MVSAQTPGGGGCKVAWERPIEQVITDIALGKISVERARTPCGVVLEPRSRGIRGKLFEPRAAMSLSRLWQRQDQRKAARQLLTECYNWFTEGFATAALQEARALLQQLGG